MLDYAYAPNTKKIRKIDIWLLFAAAGISNAIKEIMKNFGNLIQLFTFLAL